MTSKNTIASALIGSFMAATGLGTAANAQDPASYEVAALNQNWRTQLAEPVARIPVNTYTYSYDTLDFSMPVKPFPDMDFEVVDVSTPDTGVSGIFHLAALTCAGNGETDYIQLIGDPPEMIRRQLVASGIPPRDGEWLDPDASLHILGADGRTYALDEIKVFQDYKLGTLASGQHWQSEAFKGNLRALAKLCQP